MELIKDPEAISHGPFYFGVLGMMLRSNKRFTPRIQETHRELFSFKKSYSQFSKISFKEEHIKSKKRKSGNLTLPYFKVYSKDIVIKTT